MTDISDLSREVHNFTAARGWWDFPQEERVERLLDWIIEEVEETRDAYREHRLVRYWKKDAEGHMKPEGFGIELADILLLVLDLAAGTGQDIVDAAKDKMIYNRIRTYRRDAAGQRIEIP